MKWLQPLSLPDPTPVPPTFDEKHTPEHPYCDDLSCWCHTNLPYHDTVQHPDRRQSAQDAERAYRFFGIGRRGGR
ncbi:hypothetical protein [Dictyobacter arantiisoli]|uniref:Uncharacterized protein n=1 Tax=Dictyobacter arantiisoli TaxID=2014874 RepID=A0A5A5TH44_9CHLR|nr:hypothetical protein [Dictyobacter arantiisoli]GCF10890.1 hypothetical protein KDI_44540 [Dictyobacter arantiisoli]